MAIDVNNNLYYLGNKKKLSVYLQFHFLDYFPPIVCWICRFGIHEWAGLNVFPLWPSLQDFPVPTKDLPFRQKLCPTTSPLLWTKEPSILPFPSCILCSWTSLKLSWLPLSSTLSVKLLMAQRCLGYTLCLCRPALFQPTWFSSGWGRETRIQSQVHLACILHPS